MNILEKLTSKDSHQIWSASCDIAKCTDIDELKALSDHLDSIMESTKGINLGGGFCPNSYHLEFALKKLEYVKRSAGCLCSLYPEYMFYSPVKEQDSGCITIDKAVEIDGKWNDYYLCHCNQCLSKFKVKEREGHFTWWAWQKVCQS
jgi:hypothetical protein